MRNDDYALLLGLPCGVSEEDVLKQKDKLKNNFVEYFSSKNAAGVVEIKR